MHEQMWLYQQNSIIWSYLAYILRPNSKNKKKSPLKKVIVFSYIPGNETF